MSPYFFPQTEGVQVLPVRRLPVRTRSVREDDDADGRHQQGPSGSVHRARCPRRPRSHAGRQPGHGGR